MLRKKPDWAVPHIIRFKEELADLDAGFGETFVFGNAAAWIFEKYKNKIKLDFKVLRHYATWKK